MGEVAVQHLLLAYLSPTRQGTSRRGGVLCAGRRNRPPWPRPWCGTTQDRVAEALGERRVGAEPLLLGLYAAPPNGSRPPAPAARMKQGASAQLPGSDPMDEPLRAEPLQMAALD